MAAVREPLLILMGAGASVGLAPSSEALTARLKTWDPENRGRGLFEPYLSVLSHDDTSRANFEDVIALLDELRDRWRSRTNPSYEWALAALEAKRRPAAWPIVNAAIRTYEPPGHRRSANGSFALSWLAHDARAYVLEHVWQSVAAVPGHDLREAPINRTIRVLAEHFQCTVASLNYDHVLDFLGILLDHGFNPFTDQPAPFDPSWELRAVPDDAIRFLPLHGSVHFGFAREFPGQIRWFPQIEQAADSWSTIQEAFRRQDHHEPLMVAGRDKTRHILASPYGAYHAALRRSAMTIDKWLVIGYSGGDRHINAMLHDALAVHIQAQRPLSVTTIGLGAGSVFHDNWAIGFNSDLPWLAMPDRDGGSWSPLKVVARDAQYALGFSYTGGIESVKPTELIQHIHWQEGYL